MKIKEFFQPGERYHVNLERDFRYAPRSASTIDYVRLEDVNEQGILVSVYPDSAGQPDVTDEPVFIGWPWVHSIMRAPL